MRFEPAPRAVLFDLFHTLVSVPRPEHSGERPVPEILGVSAEEWQRRYYDDDVLGRAVGRVIDPFDAMRLVTHGIDPTVSEARIRAAVESRRRRFALGLTQVEPGILSALDRLIAPWPYPTHTERRRRWLTLTSSSSSRRCPPMP